jgi:rod shape-determining protein MreB and related proteins
MSLLDFLKDTIGIDPGSQNLRIIKDGKLLYNEPTQISFDKVNNIVTGLGNSIEITKSNIIRPVDCIIADFHGFEMMLRGAISNRINTKSLLPRSYRMYFTIPTSTTESEKRVYRDSAEHCGAFEVYMIYQSFCSAIAMNILFEKRHFVLIDFSSSKIEISVFANGLIISSGVVRMGTWKIFRLLKNYLKRKYQIEATEIEIESLFEKVESIENQDEIDIQYTIVKTSEIKTLLANFFSIINDELMEVIERVSNHSDIQKVIMNGIYFTGGGSAIHYLREQIRIDSGLKSTLSQNPLLDNINGLKKVIADKEKYKTYLMV